MTEADIVGGFQRLQVVGAGAQARVWKARCVADVHGIVPVGTIVALKIRSEHGENAEAQWCKTEARVRELTALDHPNIVRYLGCFREKGDDEELHVIVQEFLAGETLKDRLDALNRWNPGKDRLGLDVDEGVKIVSQVADGLGHAASRGIFHRDVKPGNIFLCTDGTAKVIDFGVARQGDGTVTEEGNIRGSWNYLAPDFTDGVFRGDQQSDIFSVGVVLYEIVTGRLPYLDGCGDDTAAYFARWSGGSNGSPVRIVSNVRRLLLGIDTVFDKTLTPDRSLRYRDFAQLRKALDAVTFIEQRHEDRTYRRVQFVGEGGFGEVFKARWIERGECVAIKMLKNAEGARRFYAEAEVMKRLDDACFTRFIDFFEQDGRAFLVMAFLEGMPGSSLRDAINRSRIEAQMRNEANPTGGLPKKLALLAFERYARGLDLMHAHVPTVIHRDIKPSNLYFPDGHPERVAIMDFGIVRMGDASTVSGMAPCTFDYAPPEIALTQDRGGPGMDIFALGLCLYEALTGKLGYPRIASGNVGILQFMERCKDLKEPVFDDPRVTEDPELLQLLRRMTHPDVVQRITSADKVAQELRRLLYRDSDGSPADGVLMDANTDCTVAIEDDKLMRWFDAWRAANPVDEKRLMQIYREQWLEEHKDDAAPSVRMLPRRSRWKTPILMLGCVVLTTVAAVFLVPLLNTDIRLRKAQEVQRKLEDENAQLEDKTAQLEDKNAQTEQEKQTLKAQLEAEKAKQEAAEKAKREAAEKIRLQKERREKRRAARLKDQQKQFADDFDGWLQLTPVQARRTRLAYAEKMLDRAVGDCVELDTGRIYVRDSDEVKRFYERLGACKKMVVGCVQNLCGDLVTVDGQSVSNGASLLCEFADGNPAARFVTRIGYEPFPLPDDFDGQTLTLLLNTFSPSPVRVTLPEDVDEKVTCFCDGRKVTGPVMVKPRFKPYVFQFEKRDYVPKTNSVVVEVGCPVQLAPLGAWQLKFPGNTREMLDAATEYCELGTYDQAFEFYYQACTNGCWFDATDWGRIHTAYRKVRDVLVDHIDNWERRPLHQDSHRKIEEYRAELGELNKKYKEMKKRKQ